MIITSKSTIFQQFRDIASKFVGHLPTRSHEFGSCLVTSSSAMEALGSPSISQAPTGKGHAFRIPKTSECRWQVQQYTFMRLTEIHFTASGFFLKIFDCLCILSLFLFGLVFLFFASLHIMKSRKKEKKKNIENNNSLRTGRTNTLMCRSFYRLSHKKSVKPMSYLNSYIKVYLMH